MAELNALVGVLKAAGESTRLRLLRLLADGDHTVKDLTEILHQSQPRVSRHLKLLADAGLVERNAEGAWAYYSLARRGAAGEFARPLIDSLDPHEPELMRDRERQIAVREAHQHQAADYFAKVADSWDVLRSLHVPESAVEAAITAELGGRNVDLMVDLGTGTGRMLEVLADTYTRGLGIDSSREMLAVARAKLASAGITHAQVRLGDITDLDTSAGQADVVVLHQVLHYFDDPGRTLAEVHKLLKPGGEMLVIDFAPHELEFLRMEHAHRRLGLSQAQIRGWAEAVGLEVVSFKEFPSTSGAEGLTVCLWRLAEAGAAKEESMHSLLDQDRLSRQSVSQRPELQLSFEFFPPKTDAMEERFWDSIHKLAPLKPRFVSVTYGAGGSTRERTLRMVSQVKAQTGVDAAAHLTCVAATREEVNAVVRGYAQAGIARIVALRGDPPEGVGQPFTPHPEGYRNAADLVAGIRNIADFDISVAAYPEKHPQSGDWDTDIDNLKRKLDAGATRAITQMFFDNADYLRYVERARKAGVTAPIVPGIQPIHSFKQISGFAGRCGASIPMWIAERFEGLEDDPETHALVAAAVAAEQVTELLDEGIAEFHFYTLNRSNLVLALARLLGRRPG